MKQRFPKYVITAALIFLAVPILAANSDNEIRNLSLHSETLIFSDSRGSVIYGQTGDSLRVLVKSRGAGQDYEIRGENLFYKVITADGLMQPARLNLSSGKTETFATMTRSCSRPDAAVNGLTVYTVGTRLLLSDGRSYDLNAICHLPAISPDAGYTAFNDNADQLWILDNASGQKQAISDMQQGYYDPRWADNSHRILYSGLNGHMYCYDMATRAITDLGEGHEARWMDNEHIIFVRKHIQDMQLINTEIMVTPCDKANAAPAFPDTPAIERSPMKGPDGHIYYFDETEKTLRSVDPASKSLPQEIMKISGEPDADNITPPVNEALDPQLEVPYVHQVYDVPNWYWGYYACAPTTASMNLAYYHLLPEWPAINNSPYRHSNNYGNYVCEKYTFNETNFYDGRSPNGYAAGYGGYGYMWTNGSPNSKMLNYYKLHGLTGTQKWDNQNWSDVTSNIDAGAPYSLCVWLTSAGHLILAKGYDPDGRKIVIVNDPYGNKNTAGYPSYDGYSACYDWPGYNYGYNTLADQGAGIPWTISTRYTPGLAVSDSLIDDRHIDQGFILNCAAPSSMTEWKDKKSGFNGHFWYTKTKAAETEKAWASWNPDLPREGMYTVSVYMPTLTNKAADAVYVIYALDGADTLRVDQNGVSDGWMSLGDFMFPANQVCLKILDNSQQADQNLVVDAAKFIYQRDLKADFTASATAGSVPMTVRFGNISDLQTDRTGWAWDYGDGHSSNALEDVHVYKHAGTFSPRLTATYDSTGYISAEGFTITVAEEPAADFSLLSPARESAAENLRPVLSWENPDSTKSFHYVIALSGTSIMSDAERTYYSDTTFSAPDSDLVENQEYFWQVTALSDNGDTLLSPINWFTVNSVNDMPPPFTLLSPQINEAVAPDQLTFTWENNPDPDYEDSLTYRLFVGPSPNTLSRIYMGSATSYTPDILYDDNQTLYWIVLAEDTHYSETMNQDFIHSFYVNAANEAPEAATMITPGPDSTVTVVQPQFIWRPASDPDPGDSVRYQLVIWYNGKSGRNIYDLQDTSFADKKLRDGATLNWTVGSIDLACDTTWSDTFQFHIDVAPVGLAENEIPNTFRLFPSYPNPFNGTTLIPFDLPAAAQVTISIYSITGQRIQQFRQDYHSAGHYSYSWTPAGVSSGIYFIHLSAPGFNATGKCLYLK